MTHVQTHHQHSPPATARDTAERSPQLETESWADTLVIAGLVVLLGTVVFLLTG